MYLKKVYLLLFIPLIFIIYLFTNNNNEGIIEQPKFGQTTETSRDINVMLIPLDDRPANMFVPIHAGKSAGINVLTPPVEFLGNFTTPAKVEEIIPWALENAEHVDGFVISADMIAYGGLVASRTAEGQTLDGALQNLNVIKELNERYPEKPLFVFDTIQRLTVTSTSKQYLQYYEYIREWAIVYDEVHHLGKKERSERLEELEALIPSEVLDDYKRARARNNNINHTLVNWVKEGYIDYLVISQDDASSNGLHRKERVGLQAEVSSLNIEGKVEIFPGADEVDIVLISRFAHQVYNISPSFYIHYSGVEGKNWIAPFEDIPFDENVRKHILASGGSIAQSVEDADIQLMINTLPVEGKGRKESIGLFVDNVGRLLSQGKTVAIADVIYYKADKFLVEQLKKQGYLQQLHSYAAWNTAGNTVGFVIGHSGLRTSFLKNQQVEFSEEDYIDALKANLEFILHRVVKDYSYKNNIIEISRKYVTNIGGDQWNLGEDYSVVNEFVKEKVGTEGLKIVDDFFGEFYYLGNIDGVERYAQLEELEELHVKLPWPRLFEAEIEHKVSLLVPGTE